MSKKIKFICQSKGGAGKSALTFLLAEKYPDAIIVDMDDSTQTTMKHVAWRDPQFVSFLNDKEQIDRGTFTSFIEEAAEADADCFICDLGGSTSQQLPAYFRNINVEELKTVFTEAGVDFELVCVLTGGSLFKSCFDYLDELYKSVKSTFPLKVILNTFTPVSADQRKVLDKFLAVSKLEFSSFTISKDATDIVQGRIAEVLKSGKGLAGASAFSRMYFKQAIKDLPL